MRKIPLPTFGWILFVIGGFMLLHGLSYDPTVPSSDGIGERIYNTGAINIKETYTNSGGYFAVCGAIFITCSKTKVD
jgi:hypothetical protein